MSKVIFAIGIALLFSVIIAVFQAVEGRGVDLVILTIHNLGFVFGTGAATIV